MNHNITLNGKVNESFNMFSFLVGDKITITLRNGLTTTITIENIFSNSFGYNKESIISFQSISDIKTH